MSSTGVIGEPRPRDREGLLARVGEHKAKIYHMVRTILDDLEAVAPWDGLYYPPTGTAEFLGMETALVGMIQDIPQRVATLTRALSEADVDDATRDVVDNMDFYFQGIQVSVASELAKLSSKLTELESGDALRSLSFTERAFICEISADLKGKYTSSIMGAAASLIAEGLWSGVEIEPILFPEKAEEFDRNEQLVEALSEVTETIGNFLDQVPLMEVIASWEQQRRVDQYALAPFYSLLGNLGKLMQVSSRRALYSGDYHQIQQRESQLSTRINQLLTHHNSTWRTETEVTEHELATIYPTMVKIATELATILDVEILRKIIGQNGVKELHFIVTVEKEDESAGREDEERKQSRRARMPEHHRDLVQLLYDEDLKTFLELLLGSVLKRASLAIKRDNQQPVPPELAELMDEPSPELIPPAGPTSMAATGAETALSDFDPMVEDLFPEESSMAPDAFDTPQLEAPPLEAPAMLEPHLQAPVSDDPPLHGAPLHGAPLHGAPLHGAPLHGAPLHGAPLQDLSLDDFSLNAPALEDLSLAAPPSLPAPSLADPSLADPSLVDPSLPAPSLEDLSLRAPSLEELSISGLTSDGEASIEQELYPPSFDAVAPPAGARAVSSVSPAPATFADPALDETAMSIRRAPADPSTLRLEALQSLNLVLQPLLSRSSSQRKSFELVRRLLKQQRAIPEGLLQSMRPYLREISSELIPRLRRDERLEDMLVSYGAELSEHCQILCDPQLSPEAAGVDLPASMEQVLELLNHLAIATRSSIGRLASEIETPPDPDPLGW